MMSCNQNGSLVIVRHVLQFILNSIVLFCRVRKSISKKVQNNGNIFLQGY